MYLPEGITIVALLVFSFVDLPGLIVSAGNRDSYPGIFEGLCGEEMSHKYRLI